MWYFFVYIFDYIYIYIYICYLDIISTWRWVWPFICTNLNHHHPSMLCAKFAWNWPSGSKEDFESFRYNLNIFAIISPFKRVWPFIWTNLNPLHPRMLCARFGWNWSSGSLQEDENVKSLQTERHTNRLTDRRRTKSDQKSPLELQLRWAKNYKIDSLLTLLDIND